MAPNDGVLAKYPGAFCFPSTLALKLAFTLFGYRRLEPFGQGRRKPEVNLDSSETPQTGSPKFCFLRIGSPNGLL